jgi:hypothetical protein
MADSTSRTSPLRDTVSNVIAAGKRKLAKKGKKNPYDLLPDMMFKKGGVVKALKGGKSRDGIAKRGLTRAPQAKT